MENIPELIVRLLEIQNGGRPRTPKLAADTRARFACPYCKEKTDVPEVDNFWMVDAARAACDQCAKEFVIVESFPMTQELYRAASPNSRPLREKSGQGLGLSGL